jgi:hypothetical protein
MHLQMYIKTIFTAFETFSVAVDFVYMSSTESKTGKFAVDLGMVCAGQSRPSPLCDQ